jgi:hypothetical protein|tara:strand:+ start:1209 stop:1529 length:321 start_codon:yes stop_codon:yes gene_type:complete
MENKKYEYFYFLNKKFKNWNSKQFNWKSNSWHLCKYCSNYFNIWWDPNKFDWVDDSDYLALYCFEYFEIWWDPNKFNWKDIFYLFDQYSKYKDIWEKDYLIWKLRQ